MDITEHVINHLLISSTNFKFLQSSELAELLASNANAPGRIVFRHISNFSISFHSFLFKTSDFEEMSLENVNLALNNSSVSQMVTDMFLKEDERLKSLYNCSTTETEKQIILNTLFSFYGIVCLDGLRSSLWLARALHKSKQIKPISDEFIDLSNDLNNLVYKSVGVPNLELDRYDEHKALERSVYEAYQEGVSYLSNILQINLNSKLDDFAPKLDKSTLMTIMRAS